ncbi:glycine cleavage system aminomethyltransferase T [unidentified eubacterium SCB49]|nr:glycine cleavage system aminomethyltransferase T [unidentified eubacterium SCB49]
MKLTKFIIKTLYFFPVGFILGLLSNGFNFNDLIMPLLYGFILGFIIVFWNVFEYEKYSNISSVDFLESRHKKTIPYSLENWQKIKQLLQLQFLDLQIIRQTDDFMEVIILQRTSNSALIIKKKEDVIELDIHNLYWKFLPDFAVNYRLISKLKKNIIQENSLTSSV